MPLSLPLTNIAASGIRQLHWLYTLYYTHIIYYLQVAYYFYIERIFIENFSNKEMCNFVCAGNAYAVVGMVFDG